MDCGSWISYGFSMFFLAGHSVLPNSKTFPAQLSPSHTPSRRTQLPKIVPIHRGETDNFKT